MAGYHKLYGARISWHQSYENAVWFTPESVLEPILKRVNMISGLEVEIEQIEIKQ
jgi:hypothetical protein